MSWDIDVDKVSSNYFLELNPFYNCPEGIPQYAFPWGEGGGKPI